MIIRNFVCSFKGFLRTIQLFRIWLFFLFTIRNHVFMIHQLLHTSALPFLVYVKRFSTRNLIFEMYIFVVVLILMFRYFKTAFVRFRWIKFLHTVIRYKMNFTVTDYLWESVIYFTFFLMFSVQKNKIFFLSLSCFKARTGTVKKERKTLTWLI